MTNNLNKLAEAIKALPRGAVLQVLLVDGIGVYGSLSTSLPVADLKALEASWERRGEALEEATSDMVRICAVDGRYGKQIATAFVEEYHPAFAREALDQQEGE